MRPEAGNRTPGSWAECPVWGHRFRRKSRCPRRYRRHNEAQFTEVEVLLVTRAAGAVLGPEVPELPLDSALEGDIFVLNGNLRLRRGVKRTRAAG